MTKQVHILHDEAAKDRIIGLIQALNLERPWEVEVRPKTKQRSLSQNATIHMWFGIIADYTGDSEASVKADIKAMLAPQVESKIKAGEFRPQDTSEMRTTEMSEFMERLNAWATSELGLLLPHPDDMGRRRSMTRAWGGLLG